MAGGIASRLALFGAAGVFAHLAIAQSPPDAGALRRQIEREQQAQPPQRQPPELEERGQAIAAPGGVLVNVKSFVFTGNHLIGSDELARVVAPWTGRPADLAALQAAAAVGAAYRARGWVVRSQLPRQDVSQGEVRIDIVEARLGRIFVEGREAGRVPIETVKAFVGARLQAGEALATPALDRGLMLADDLPGVVVAGRLLAGIQPGETDVALKLDDEPLLVGEASGTSGPGNANASGSGDININSAITWSTANTLTLDAYRNVNINAAISAGTVTANDDTRPADGRLYSGGNGASYTGLVAGDSAGMLLGQLVYGGTSQGASLPGTYDIAVAGLSSPNYTLHFVDGTLVLVSVAPPPGGSGDPGSSGSTGNAGSAGGAGGSAGSGAGGLGGASTGAVGGANGEGAGASGGGTVDDGWSTTGAGGGLGGNGPGSGVVGGATGGGGGGGGTEIGGAGTGRHDEAAGADGSEELASDIVIEQVVKPTESITGIVTIWVPYDIATNGTGFAFPLPQGLAALAGADADVTVSRLDGGPLPQWLHYDAKKRVFIAGAVPNGALPWQVVVVIKGLRTIVAITGRPRQAGRN